MKLHLSLPVWKGNIIDSANNVNIGSRLHSVWAAVSAPTRLTNWRDCKLDVFIQIWLCPIFQNDCRLSVGFPHRGDKKTGGKKKTKQRMVMCLARRDYFDVWWRVFLTHTVKWRLVRLSHSHCRRRSIRHYSGVMGIGCSVVWLCVTLWSFCQM